MGLLLWIVFGALVGIAASALMKSSNGLILDTLLGIVDRKSTRLNSSH